MACCLSAASVTSVPTLEGVALPPPPLRSDPQCPKSQTMPVKRLRGGSPSQNAAGIGSLCITASDKAFDKLKAKLSEYFKLIDTNDTGHIDKSEIREASRKLGYDYNMLALRHTKQDETTSTWCPVFTASMRQLDKDGNVTLHEFVSHVQNDMLLHTKKMLETLIEQYEAGIEAKLVTLRAFNELTEAHQSTFAQLKAKLTQQFVDLDSAATGHIDQWKMIEALRTIAEDEYEAWEIVLRMDVDKDGKISLEEYLNYFQDDIIKRYSDSRAHNAKLSIQDVIQNHKCCRV